MENNQIGVICIVENKVGIEIFNINEDSFIKKEAVGLGKYYKISNSYGNGHILIYKNNMVHASFFKKIENPTVNNEIIKNIQNNKQTIC